jgi:hypothetical protein
MYFLDVTQVFELKRTIYGTFFKQGKSTPNTNGNTLNYNAWTLTHSKFEQLHAVLQNNLREAVMPVVQIMSPYNSYKPREKLYIINTSQSHLQFSEVLFKPSQFETLS